MSTDLKDALTRMQERWPSAECGLDTSSMGNGTWCACVSLPGDIEWLTYGPTPHAAVDAAINAWDAAVKADALTKVLKAECKEWRAHDETPATEAGKKLWAWAACNIARAATDEAGALR